jgi:hypothetical protein
VALANIMRLSSKKGAHLALSSAAWQEIWVRFGRDDKGEGGAPMGERPRTKGVFSSPWVGRKPMTPLVELTILLQLRFRVSPGKR